MGDISKRIDTLSKRMEIIESIFNRISQVEESLTHLRLTENDKVDSIDNISFQEIKELFVTLEELEDIIYKAEIELDIIEERIDLLESMSVF